MRITKKQPDRPGNNFRAVRSKTIYFRITANAGDPNTQYFFPDDFELNGKQIVGVIANTCRQTFATDGDINGTLTPGFLQYGLTNSDMLEYTATFVNEKGEEIHQNTPLNCLNSLRKNGAFSIFPGFVYPLNTKLNLRMCYIKSIQPSVNVDAYAVFTFYFNN